jgi:hypothetical protein
LAVKGENAPISDFGSEVQQGRDSPNLKHNYFL